MQKVANTIRNVNGFLHKFKYVFPHIILFYIYTVLIEFIVAYSYGAQIMTKYLNYRNKQNIAEPL